MQIARCVKGVAAATVALAAFSAAATAQQQPPPGGGGFGQGGARGGGGGFGQGSRGGGFGQMTGRNTELTLAGVPLDVMTPALRLTENQQGQIKAIQDALQTQRQQMMGNMRGNFGGPGGGQGGPGGGGQGGPGGDGGQGGGPGGGGQGGPGGQGGGFAPQAMQQRMQQMQQMQQQMQTNETNASRRIAALLTEEQRAALTPAMREWKIVQQMGLPLTMAGSLKLSEEQKTVLEKHFAAQGNGQQGRRRMQIQGAPPQGGQQ